MNDTLNQSIECSVSLMITLILNGLSVPFRPLWFFRKMH